MVAVAGAAGTCGGPPKAKMAGGEKLIIRSDKVRLIDILSMLLLRRPITSYSFVEASEQTTLDVGDEPCGIIVPLTEIIIKFLAAAYWPAKVFCIALEFLLNFVALNGGMLGLGIIWNIFRCKLVIPLNRQAPDFRTIIGMIDGRTELKLGTPEVAGGGGDMRQLHVHDTVVFGEAADLESGECTLAALLVQQRDPIPEVTVMAAKIAYENPAYIENVVNNVWKFNFVGFYNGWNSFLNQDTTQAFVMTDRAKDASAVVLAFRGTEPFNTRDWSTDVELSWLGLGAMGHVHVGFLKALGLQEVAEDNAERAFPRKAPKGNKSLAYYQLREVVRQQLDKHPAARLVVTGHSLGGALAAIFPALLALHEEKGLLGRLGAVLTYGQPRVGDGTFVGFLTAATKAARYDRVVYRYDFVPRVPFTAPVARYSHGGTCVYYDGWYDGKELAGDEPDPNYFDPRYVLSKYGNAVGDLLKAAFLWASAGSDYREGICSLAYRCGGLIFPGFASHSPRDYVDAVRLGRITPKQI
uniref:Predicted protein n=1 Tax=Hordeum vulgare subsp. vulgare TaxID=112509 RepID=F2E997_HORVV|nr:predicted protein [Hordeum vulgare subsp. vulgare]